MPGQDVYITGGTDERGKGVYECDLAIEDNGVGMECRTAISLEDDPSFLAAHPSGRYLYVVHEVQSGGVTALRRDCDGTLVPLNRVPSGAGGPCHCSVHPSGRYLFVAHYTGGAVSVLPIGDDGRLAPPTDTIHHGGSSVHQERQTRPHPHSITPGPNGRYLYVPDLGTDEIVVYGFDGEEESLSRVEQIPTRAGAGPRHIAFHPDEPLVHVVNELDSTMSTFQWSPENGGLTNVATTSTVPDGHDGDNFPAHVLVHPSGRWVYGSNRGHDSIVVFGSGGDRCELTTLGHRPTGGHWPRHFAIDATGQYLLVANRQSDDIRAFRIDDATGCLDPTDNDVRVPGPTCTCCLPTR